MIDPPQTLEEARAYRYCVWAGNSKGIPYQEGLCAYSVWNNHLFPQCSRKNGKGLDGLYCGIHAKRVKVAEIVEAEKTW